MVSRLFYLFFCLVLSVSISNASQPELTEAQKDGYIIFNYSMNDALHFNKDTISKKVQGDATIYDFKDNVLSCGTHMTGVIKVTESKEKTSYNGTFAVEKNPFKINSLIIDFSETKNMPVKRAGKINIDGKDYDINLFF
jgi:hypothetical protein